MIKKILTSITLLINLIVFAQTENFSFTESFEGTTTMTNWVKSSGMNMPTPNFTYGAPGPGGGTSSIHITAHIDGLANPDAKWYYYLKIPVNSPEANDGGSLSFSADVMVDDATKDHVRFGYNTPYYPISRTGVGFLSSYISTANTWQTIQRDDVSTLLFNKKDRAIRHLAYDGNPNDLGITLNMIGILVFGKGPLDLSLYLDNISLTGTHTNPASFAQGYTDSWNAYLARVHDSIDIRNTRFTNLPEIVNTDGVTLCTKQQFLLDRLNSSYAEIQQDIATMYAINASSNSTPNYFNASLMNNVDHLLESYLSSNLRLAASLDTQQELSAYKIDAMKYYRFNGYDTPDFLEEVTSYNLRMTRGEYRSIATLLEPMCIEGDGYTIENTNFIGDNGSFDASNLDTYVAKIWYQAGLNNTHINRTEKFITPELLLKDESLVKVNFTTETNELKIIDNATNVESYINISEQNGTFPDTRSITFNDSNTLQPINFDAIRYKLIWNIIHVPDNVVAGSYTSTFKIKNPLGEVMKEFPITIEVLPFDLAASKLVYSLYYPARIVDNAIPVNSYQKTVAQFSLELEDLKKHGVLYPNSYNRPSKLGQELDIRNQLGFPTDRFYTLGIGIFPNGVQSTSVLTNDITNFQNILASKGYNANELYIYAIDEATTANEIGYMNDVHNAGAKVFVAGYTSTFDMVGQYLDQIVFAGGATSASADTQVANWHGAGKLIFSYASPQVGVENPEVYRRNFGIKLWQKGFDGAMDWAYQAHRGAFWNDFDGTSNYREEAFTYPTTSGLVGTIAWEGYRAGITDVRYISTLLDVRDSLLANGVDVTDLNNFIDGIDTTGDLDVLLETIIDKILESYGTLDVLNTETNNSSFTIIASNDHIDFNLNSNEIGAYTLEVFDILGQSVWKKEGFKKGTEQLTIPWDLKDNPTTGIYISNLKLNGKILSKKFVVMQ